MRQVAVTRVLGSSRRERPLSLPPELIRTYYGKRCLPAAVEYAPDATRQHFGSESGFRTRGEGFSDPDPEGTVRIAAHTAPRQLEGRGA
jgi:hypothetical protein